VKQNFVIKAIKTLYFKTFLSIFPFNNLVI